MCRSKLYFPLVVVHEGGKVEDLLDVLLRQSPLHTLFNWSFEGVEDSWFLSLVDEVQGVVDSLLELEKKVHASRNRQHW